MSLLTYKYYDTPEGHDIYKKVFVTSKYGAMVGLSTAFFDVLMYSKPVGVVATAGRVLYFAGPLAGMGAAFSVTTNVAHKIRGKNDPWNYFLGGVAAGSIYGAWQRNATAAVPLALLLGAAGMLKKAAVDEGWPLWPIINSCKQNATSAGNDWTLVKDIEEMKGWTTGKQ